MPKKLDPDSKRSTKILKLYSLLLRNDKEYSTAELMEYLKCSKQTIRGIVDDLNESGLISVEERKVHNKNVFRIEHCRPGIYEPIALEGFRQMEMCRDILGSMLPKEDFESLNRAIFEAQNYLPRHERSNFKTFSVAVGFTKGYIDYSKFKDILHNLYKCIMENKCCYIEHSRLINTQTKRHMFAPKRVKCYRETFYITGWIIDESQSEIKAKYDNPAMFSIHRIKNVQIIEDKSSSALPPVSVEKKNSYGIISDSEPFKVTLRFTEDYAITYVADRTWSKDQKITLNDDGSMTLTFMSESVTEVKSFVLSFGSSVEVIEPQSLRNDIINELALLQKKYL